MAPIGSEELGIPPWYWQFAQQLVKYSTEVQEGDQVIIHVQTCIPEQMVVALIRAVQAAKAYVADVWTDSWLYDSEVLQFVSDQSLQIRGEGRLKQLEKAKVNIILRGQKNPFDMARVPPDNMRLWSKGIGKQILDLRVKTTRWVLGIWPFPYLGFATGQPTLDFERFYFKTVLVNYARMSLAMDPLVALMEKTDKVRIVGPGDTDLTFSIKGIPVVKCDGHRNIPDGEVYTAPVRTSIQGVMHYNTDTISKNGHEFGGIRFVFENGQIVDATCDSGDQAELDKELDIDPGARFVGEFAIGVNPMIKNPMKDTLFDEKIGGSFHLTPGQCYDEAPNGNDSANHWDIVGIHTPEFGGGKIYFDDVLIRKDGEFVLDELLGLNPDALLAN